MIYYKLETKLTGKSLSKMIETIPPLIQLITNIVEENEAVETIINEMKKQLPYSVSNWLEDWWITNQYEVRINLQSSVLFQTIIILDFKDVIRDLKIKEVLKDGYTV